MNYINAGGCKKIGSAIGSVKFCSQSQQNKFDKAWTKIDGTVEFIANHMYLIMGNIMLNHFS